MMSIKLTRLLTMMSALCAVVHLLLDGSNQYMVKANDLNTMAGRLRQRSGLGTHRMHAADTARYELSAVPISSPYVAARTLQAQNNSSTGDTGAANEVDASGVNEVPHYGNAVLFPAFAVVVGAVVYYLLTRLDSLSQYLPHTAVMFVIGTFMGVSVGMQESEMTTSHLMRSTTMWSEIPYEVLLLAFLPGILFNDAFSLNAHLFRSAIWQNLIFALVLVLAGTVLTALVAFYIFPWDWSFNLCMTFGAILSAIDPVAVVALMQELGAPPRLKVHITGEALLNDGSAVVFWSIFALRYLFEMGVEGIGANVDWGSGIAIFCRMALGGAAIGFFFALLILIMLKMFSRRFTTKENVYQVAAMFGLAYVNYFTADIVWETSGIIATVVAGVTVKYFGQAATNNEKMFSDFWTLVETILITVIFTLAGVVFGNAVASDAFQTQEWGYLFVLYIMLTIIRYFIFFAGFPVSSRMELGASWQETVFQSHAGVRGVVSIALALSLDNRVTRVTSSGAADPIYRQETRQVFGFVGGIVLLTLLLNASTCTPLLKYLGLSEPSQAHKKVLDAYKDEARKQAVEDMVRLLSQPRFSHVEFDVIKEHVPPLANLTTSELAGAVKRFRDITPANDYRTPKLDGIIPYLDDDKFRSVAEREELLDSVAGQPDSDDDNRTDEHKQNSQTEKSAPKDAVDIRKLFLSSLESAYKKQVANGELAERDFLTICLEQSVQLALDRAKRGKSLCDWDFVDLVEPELIRWGTRIKGSKLLRLAEYIRPGTTEKVDDAVKHLKIERALAFTNAHQTAQEEFKKQLSTTGRELSDAGKIVMHESEQEVDKATEVLENEEKNDVEKVKSHKFCTILLSLAINRIEDLVGQGLMKESEAEQWAAGIQKHIVGLSKCHKAHRGQ